MTDQRSETCCVECATALPAAPPEGLCPACLLTQALRDQTTLPVPVAAGEAPVSTVRIRYLGDYELLDVIGRGASGVVYRARQTSLDRTVAVKLLASGVWSSDEMIARFRSEAKSAARLKHPRIVAIYEVGEHDGQPYFSMEHIKGQNLEQRLCGGPLSVERAAEIVRILAEAVDFAHQQGIVHRDLKPSNVVVDDDWQPHITDFGLAKNLAFEHGLTSTGAVLGTPGYMPPEQADASDSSPADPRGDIYSLGAILYALLTGSPPFRKDTPFETILETVRSRPQPPRRLRTAVPKDLEIVCMRCLEKEPADRYATAGELADDLARFQGGRPIAGRRGGVVRALSRWVGRHRGLAATLVVAGLIALAAGLRLSSSRQQRFLVDLGQQQGQIFEARQDQLAELLAAARESRRQGDRWRALELLGEAARIEPTAAVRREAMEVAFSPGLRRAFSFPTPLLSRVSFSAEGDRLAVMGHDFQTQRWSLEVRAAGGGELLERFESSPDERTTGKPFSPWFAVAVGEGVAQQLKIWDRRRGELVTVAPPTDLELPGQAAAERAWAVSPSGRRVAYGPFFYGRGRGIRTLGVKDLRRGTDERLPLQGSLGDFLDEQRLLYYDRGVLLTWHLSERKSTSPAPTDPLLAISEDRSTAALRAVSGTIEVWDLKRRRRRARITTGVSDKQPVRLSPEGRLLALGGGRDPVRVWDLGNPTRGARGLQPSGHREVSLRQASFSHDARLFAIPGSGRDQGRTWVWNIEAAEEIALLEGHRSPVWSPVGSRLTTLAYETETIGSTRETRPAIVMWEVAPPVPSYQLDSRVGAVAFSADGRRLTVFGELWHQTPGIYSQTVRIVQARAGLSPKIETEGQVLSVELAEADGAIDFRALATPPGGWLPAYPRSARRPDGTDIQVHPYTWAFAPGGDALVLASTVLEMEGDKPRPDPTTYLLERWDLRARSAGSPWQHGELVGALAISPDGETTAVGDHLSAGISLWRTATGERLGHLDHQALTTVIAFSPDGGKIASAGLSDQLEVSAIGGEKLAAWRLREVPRVLAFDASGELLALAGGGPEVSLWRIVDGREVARWSAHDDGVAALAFHPGGRPLVTAGAQGALKAWDLELARTELRRLGLGL